MLVLVVSLLPMFYYVRGHVGRRTRWPSMRSAEARRAGGATRGAQPRVLVGITVAYLLWSLLPVLDRGAVLVQRRPVADVLAGLLDAVVLGRPDAVGLARRQPAHGADPDAEARRDHHR